MDRIDAWLAVLTGYVCAYRRQTNGPALAGHLRTLIEDAKPVFRLLLGTRSAQEAAIQLIGRGKAFRGGLPTPAYAQALLHVKGQMTVDKEARDTLKKFLTSTDLTAEQKELADLLLLMLNPNPDNIAAKDARLDKLISILPDRTLKLAMMPQENERQDVHINEIKHLVKLWTKRSDHKLTPEEVKVIESKDPDRLKRYKELHKKAKQSWEQFVRGMVRANNDKPVKILDARKALDAAGIKFHPALDNNGMERMRIGESTLLNSAKAGVLVMYTMDGTELNMQPAPDLTLFFNPKWNARTDDTYVLQQRSPYQMEGKTTLIRSAKFNHGNRESNYDAILDAIPKIPAARHIWLKDLHGADRTRRIFGAMTEVMYHFATRIGTVGNSTVGLSTLTLDHVRLSKDGIILSYIGKDSKPQRHVLKSSDPNTEIAVCINIIKLLMRGKTRRDYLWTDARGKHITPARTNDYIRTRCGLPITGEKFRNVRGTELMEQLLANARLPKDAPINVVGDKVKKLAVHVGELLGHVRTDKEGNLQTTASTAISNYIAPSIVAKFFKDRGFQVPKWVPKAGR